MYFLFLRLCFLRYYVFLYRVRFVNLEPFFLIYFLLHFFFQKFCSFVNSLKLIIHMYFGYWMQWQNLFYHSSQFTIHIQHWECTKKVRLDSVKTTRQKKKITTPSTVIYIQANETQRLGEGDIQKKNVENNKLKGKQNIAL